MIEFKKDKLEIDTDSRDIADLCNMCGKCCRSITTEYTHQELIEMAKENKKEAHIYIDFFKRYDSIEDAKKVVPAQVEQVLEVKRETKKQSEDSVSFYYCTYIDDSNKCTIHKDRPLCCRNAPVDGWSVMPPGCGYEGWQFAHRERIKSMVRGLKEELHIAQTLLKPTDMIDGLENTTVQEFKEIVSQKLEPFERLGTKDW